MKRLHEITVSPGGRTVIAAEGATLLQAARTAGLALEAPCDGRGTCGKCQVKAAGALSVPNETERKWLEQQQTQGLRLACQAKILGPAEVELPGGQQDGFITVAAGQGIEWPLDPPVYKLVSGRFGSQEDQRDLAMGFSPQFPDNYAALLKELAVNYKQGITHMEAVVNNGKLLDWHYQPGRTCYGVALDIGTTSVVAELFNLASGCSLGVRSCLNPQTEFGGDVLTRIAFAGKLAEGTLLLQEKIIAGINRLLEQLIAARQLDSRDIYHMVVAGNTTMQHLLLGIAPHSLACAPYRPVFLQQVEVSAAKLGLAMSPRGVVTVLPSAAAFVGADIVAGLLAAGLSHCPDTALFIDIGTNGEIVVCKDGELVGTSSAAGPALEGMNITCGCRAEPGAIEGAAISGDGTVKLKVIGGGQPTGICGSGLIDLIVELVRHGVITASGRFANPEKLTPQLASRLVTMDGKPCFSLSEDGRVFLTQKDVRQVQLAKGAIRAAIDLLLKEIHVEFSEIHEILVAGAFGFHLQPASLAGIGLLPAACQSKIRFVGNTAKEGARAVLLNRRAGAEVEQIGQDLKIIELSLQPEFQDYFVRALAFPPQAAVDV
ncbi:ASKHA domain-containing protein [Sporomusa aerivorans]|uniref:ASKHA domain-containing protein n=1 Tax=Sporomusa aerivorans TaxID=204936 RepID=UPI00352A7140